MNALIPSALKLAISPYVAEDPVWTPHNQWVWVWAAAGHVNDYIIIIMPV